MWQAGACVTGLWMYSYQQFAVFDLFQSWKFGFSLSVSTKTNIAYYLTFRPLRVSTKTNIAYHLTFRPLRVSTKTNISYYLTFRPLCTSPLRIPTATRKWYQKLCTIPQYIPRDWLMQLGECYRLTASLRIILIGLFVFVCVHLLLAVGPLQMFGNGVMVFIKFNNYDCKFTCLWWRQCAFL